MNRLFIISSILFLGVLSSCREPGINPANCREGTCNYTVEENKRLRILPPVDRVQVADGDSLVFSYEYIKHDDPNIDDDEYSDHIWFQIDPSLTEFSLSNKELSSVGLVFLADCECSLEIVPIVNGMLVGKKLNNQEWEITMDVSYTWSSIVWERSFTKVFQR